MDSYKTIIGIICTLTAVLFGLGTGMLVKKVGTDVTVITTLFYRFLFSVPLLLLFALVARKSKFLEIKQKRTLILRIIFGFSGITFWFLAVRSMPLGQATTLFQSSVIFVTLLSPLLLSEKVGPVRWSAVLAGLIGIIIVTDPFSSALNAAALYGVEAAKVQPAKVAKLSAAVVNVFRGRNTTRRRRLYSNTAHMSTLSSSLASC